MYRVSYHRAAAKGLKKLTRNQSGRILSKIVEIAADPFGRHPNCTKMLDLPDGYRLRVGAMRVVYEVDSGAKTIIVWKIASRGSVYRK